VVILKAWSIPLALQKVGVMRRQRRPGCGLSVRRAQGDLENVEERNRDKSLGITVYIGKTETNAWSQ
jgi:hypothetical protein